MASEMQTFPGACHCGRVRIEVTCPDRVTVLDCNCSICRKAGYLHLIVPARRFRLVAGQVHLPHYRFNTGIASHLFCRFCGIKPFYIPRSNPDGIDVNLRCLDPAPTVEAINPFDGEHWEQHATTLADLSRE